MGFFKKLFGNDDDKQEGEPSDDAPAPPRAPLGDPYRGSSTPAQSRTPVRAAQKFTPIWDSWTDVLALERGDDQFPLRSIVYCGEASSDFQAVRRVSFVDGGGVVDWEAKLATRDALSTHLTCRVDDRIIVPRATGFVACHVVTGEPCWELPHPASLYKRPVRYPDGTLLFVFHDQSWMQLHPRDGAFHSEGRIRSDVEAQQLLDKGRPLDTPSDDVTRYSGHKLRLIFGELRVEVDDKPRPPTDRYEPPAPTPGHYPVDEWKPDEYIDLVGDKLAVFLTKQWGDRTRAAIGLFEPTSLEPLRLLELGDNTSHGFRSAHVVDDLLVVNIQLKPPAFEKPDDDLISMSSLSGFYSSVVVDTRTERVLACFAEDRLSFLFDGDGRQIWRGKL